jgi:hypothetical protein
MAVPLLKRRLFTVEEYYRMAEAGIISKDERLELIEGEIVAMAAIGSRHAACVDRLNYFPSQRVGGRALVRVQNPIYSIWTGFRSLSLTLPCCGREPIFTPSPIPDQWTFSWS